MTAPLPPVLVSPIGGAHADTTTVTFTWLASENADDYYLSVNTAADFNGTWLFNADLGDVLTYDVPDLPNTGITLYWRVQPQNLETEEWGEASEVGQFINGELSAPAAPVLDSPLYGIDVFGTTISFTWEASEFATEYFIDVNSAEDFNGDVIWYNESTGGAPYYDATGFDAAGTTYYWRVRAWNDAGYSEYSEVGSFVNAAEVVETPWTGCTILVDWDGDSWCEDDVTADVMTFTFTRGRDAELGRTQAGTCEMRLRNEDGRYSPDNQASPLYGLILPGRMVQAKYTGLSGDVYLFTGFINELRPNPRLDEQNCYIYAVDGMDALSRGAANVALQDNRHSGEIINDILDDAGWGYGRTIDTGEYNHPWVSVSGISVLEAINQLEALEYGARCFIDGQGNFVWQDSLYRRSILSTLLVDNTNTHIESTFNLLNVLNEITCEFTPNAELQPDQVIYELQNPLAVYPPYIVHTQSPGGWDYPVDRPVTLFCPYQYPCKNATFIWANLAYFDANTEPDGSGIEVPHWVTVDPSFTATSATMIINNTGGW